MNPDHTLTWVHIVCNYIGYLITYADEKTGEKADEWRENG